MFKLTFTLGPACESEAVLTELARVGHRFRLNASHLSFESLNAWLEKLERLHQTMGRLMPTIPMMPVVVDLQGAKMRIGKMPGLLEVLAGAEVRLIPAEESASLTQSVIPVPHPELFEALKEGAILSLNDGRVEFEVLAVAPGEIRAQVLRAGPLSSRKGINCRTHPIAYKQLSAADRKMIELTAHLPFIEYAFSFVHNGGEAGLLRPLIGQRPLIAKIERPEAMAYLPQLDAVFDELWFCRGDLGAQAGLKELGPLQERFCQEIKNFQHPATLAGQVLEYMTHFSAPTRSEVVHLYDIQRQGFAGIVLSDETAVGKNPVAVAQFLRETLG